MDPKYDNVYGIVIGRSLLKMNEKINHRIFFERSILNMLMINNHLNK